MKAIEGILILVAGCASVLLIEAIANKPAIALAEPQARVPNLDRLGLLASCAFSDNFRWVDGRLVSCRKFVYAIKQGKVQIPSDIEVRDKW